MRRPGPPEFVAAAVENVGPGAAVSLHRENDEDQLPIFEPFLEFTLPRILAISPAYLSHTVIMDT